MKLMSWGANSYGQLGQQTKCDECVKPSQVHLDPLSLKPEDVDRIVAGACHSFLLSKDGVVYGCGSNTCGQLADLSKDHPGFCKIPFFANTKITQLATKWETSYAITIDETCLGWGSNTFGQLGATTTGRSISPQLISSNVKQVASGLRHMLLLNNDGSVSSAGDGKKGQLGRRSIAATLEKVIGLERIVQVACGQNHNLALTSDGKVLGWGCNKFRQLSVADRDIVNEPTVICEVESTKCKLLCGWTHSAILNEKGTLISWGRNKYGQLGVAQSPHQVEPVELKFKPFDDVEFGSEHNLAITIDGELVCWGWNEHGSCGSGNTENIFAPRIVDTKGSAVKIGAGGGQSFAIVEDVR